MQLVRFLLVGALNTAVGLSCIFVAMWWLHLDYRLANALGYAIGIAVSFVLNRHWTFRYDGPWLGSLMRWLTVAAGAYALNLLVVIGLHDTLNLDVNIAQIAGNVVYTGSSFFGGRWFAFRNASRVATLRGQ